MESDSKKKIAEIEYFNKKINPNYFKIKYLTEVDRKNFAEMVIRLITIHELKNFQIEEKKAFLKNKIYYNIHTLVSGNKFTFEELEKNFLEYYEN